MLKSNYIKSPNDLIYINLIKMVRAGIFLCIYTGIDYN